MAKTSKAEQRKKGLYKNGKLWWVRGVRGPISGISKPRSTGTDDLRLANRIVAMLEELHENRPQWDWLELAASGSVSLPDLYNHRAAGTLHELRATRASAAEAADDVDVEPWVGKWQDEHLALRVVNGEISQAQADDYVRQVRALIPAGVVFARSGLTEDYVKATLLALRDPRSEKPLASATRRRYVVAWELFYKYARKRAPLLVNPFEDIGEWRPANGSPRSVHWDHDTRIAVIDRMQGEARAYLALVLGSGMEEGAADALLGRHIGKTLEDGRLIITAPGTKNEHREERTIFLDAWAAKIFLPHAKHVTPMGRIFSMRSATILRQFYRAQVLATLIAEPEVSASGKALWKAVKPHTIHDARHTYCINRLLGLDGEPRQDIKFCSHQLGHADEQMVMKIYAKTNVRERLRLIELGEAKRQGAKEATK